MRRLLLAGSLLAGVLLGLVLLRPVLLAPVVGDDIRYTLRAAADPDGGLVNEAKGLPNEWRFRVDRGRINVLTGVERRTAARWQLDAAAATGQPLRVVLAILKGVCAVLSLFAVHGLLRSLRWRRRGTGTLVRLSRPTRLRTMAAGGLGFAMGCQPQLVGEHAWNGWVSYPVSTWTAGFSIFGVVALALWVARLVATGGRGTRVGAAALFVALGGVTNLRYELTFVAVPLTLLALVFFPVTDAQDGKAGRRAKALVGGAYAAGFVPLLVVSRVMLQDVCASGGCYPGVELSLKPAVLPTLVGNVVSSIPGTGSAKAMEFLRQEGVSGQGAWTPTWWSCLLATVLLGVLALAWHASRPATDPLLGDRGAQAEKGDPGRGEGAATDGGQGDDGGADDDQAAAEATLCAAGALVLAVGAVGAAAVMSLSEKAQQEMSAVGILSRHTVVTWTGLIFALVLLVLALALTRPGWATRAYVGLAVAMALLVAVKAPMDERLATANTDRRQLTTEVFEEVAEGDTSEAANTRRCQLFDVLDRDLSKAARERHAANLAFEHYWQTKFCQHRQSHLGSSQQDQ